MIGTAPRVDFRGARFKKRVERPYSKSLDREMNGSLVFSNDCEASERDLR